MRPLTHRSKDTGRRLNIAAVAAVITGLIGSPALAGCPWIVQPSKTIVGDVPDYEIMFNGKPDPSWTYYAFTVTDHVLAWELSSGSGLAALDDRGRPLQAIDDDGRARYRVDDASVVPLTLYLVISTAPLPELDAIAADFEPARPIAVGLRVRGASDTSGPLPHRSLPGVEIRYANSEAAATEFDATLPDHQLCAYQVLIR